MSENMLTEICRKKREHIKYAKQRRSEKDLLNDLPLRNLLSRPFTASLIKKIHTHTNALIAEIKKASPSKGLIRADFNPSLLGQAYEKAGATCLSVLTDIPYFQGEDEYISEVKSATKLPILRKDFMLDPYQIIESKYLGADCILLIMAALTISEAQELEVCASELGLDVLAEVHNQAELEQALELKTPLIGINNRDLKTLKVDLNITKHLASHIPADRVVICESGIGLHTDILAMNQLGVYGFLVGESLMRQANVEQATKNLLGL